MHMLSSAKMQTDGVGDARYDFSMTTFVELEGLVDELRERLDRANQMLDATTKVAIASGAGARLVLEDLRGLRHSLGMDNTPYEKPIRELDQSLLAMINLLSNEPSS